jgi:hypothetical protein
MNSNEMIARCQQMQIKRAKIIEHPGTIEIRVPIGQVSKALTIEREDGRVIINPALKWWECRLARYQVFPLAHRKRDTALGWFGTIAQIAGAVLMAANLPVSGWAFLPFLAGSLCWLIVSLRRRLHSMATLQAVFTATNVLGVYRWLLP